MIIPSIIRALLDENSVTISGLGTFSVKKFPSQIKEDIVFPPQNLVEFQYAKEIESFDFVSKIAKWEQINIDEAQTKVTEWLNLLEKGLEHNKGLFFENFGTFSKDSSGKIAFQCMLIHQLNIENEGFEPVCLISHKKQNLPNPDEPSELDKRIILIKKKKRRDWLLFVATICITAVFLFVLFMKNEIIDFYQTLFEKNEVAAIIENDEQPAPNDEQPAIAELVEVEEEVVLPEKKEVVTVQNSSSNEKYLTYEKGKYYVIAGSFTKDEDAFRHIKERKLEKYHAKIIVQPDNPRKRVCIGVFDNETDAMKFVVQTDKNCWVLK